MTEYIEMGGESRPILFGSRANYEYERAFGHNPAEDFTAYSAKAADAAAKGLPEPSIPFVLVTNLAYSGLVCGALKQRKPITFEVHDVADWLGTDADLIVRVLTLFTDAQPKAKNAKEGEEQGEVKKG